MLASNSSAVQVAVQQGRAMIVLLFFCPVGSPKAINAW
jgi:hypothetical protein